ncbi:OmpA family protein [Breznakiellaceae bacterium SP9]
MIEPSLPVLDIYAGISCKRRLLCLFIVTLCIASLAAQTASSDSALYPWDFSFEFEINQYTAEGIANGLVLGGRYPILPVLSVGGSLGLFNDFSDFTTFEPAALVRWYPWGNETSGSLRGLFAEGKLGAALVWYDGDMTSKFLASFGAGMRIDLGGSSWYIEPQLRGGYPFAFGIGVAMVWRPQSSRQPAAREEAARPDSVQATARVEAASQAAAGAQESSQSLTRSRAAAPPETAGAQESSVGTGRSRAAAPPPETSSQETNRGETVPVRAAPELSSAAGGPVVLADGRRGYALPNLIPFLGDGSDLTQTARESLNVVGETLKQQYPNNRVLVQGHAAATGSAAGQQQISEERARNAADYLVAGGYITAGRLETQARGAGEPLASNDTWSGRQQNRRVNIIVLDN